MAAVPEDRPNQPAGLHAEDGRTGEEAREPGDRGIVASPEPAEFKAEPEAVANRLARAEPSDVADRSAFDRPDGPAGPMDRRK